MEGPASIAPINSAYQKMINNIFDPESPPQMPCPTDSAMGGLVAKSGLTHPKRQQTMTTTNSTTGDVISSEKVEGTSVYDPDGEKLGSIDDLMIDKISGEVRYAVLEFGGFLGVGTDRYPIPWRVLEYSTEKGGYIVPLDKARLNQAPKYADDSMPIYDTEYGKRIDTYYGDDLSI